MLLLSILWPTEPQMLLFIATSFHIALIFVKSKTKQVCKISTYVESNPSAHLLLVLVLQQLPPQLPLLNQSSQIQIRELLALEMSRDESLLKMGSARKA